VVMLRRQALIVSLSVFAVLGFAVAAHSDILFKARQPVKIGHGKKEGAKIHWTDCSGQNPETFDEPPYSLDLTDNCSVGPPTFGLECEGESCKVVDAEKLQRYLPGVHEGEKVHLRIEEHSVQIQSATASLRLEK
jgi:hypothetical protein